MFTSANIDVVENLAYSFWRIVLHNDWLVANGHAPDYEQVEIFRDLKRALKVKAKELRTVTDKVLDCQDFDEFYQKLCNLKGKQNEP